MMAAIAIIVLSFIIISLKVNKIWQFLVNFTTTMPAPAKGTFLFMHNYDRENKSTEGE
jgi:hypothetical protein